MSNHFANATHAILNITDEKELQQLNRCIVDHLKSIRNRDAALKRRTLCVGQKVFWDGRNGRTEGTIVRIKRKKAICDVGVGRNWDVPLSMLKAVY